MLPSTDECATPFFGSAGVLVGTFGCAGHGQKGTDQRRRTGIQAGGPARGDAAGVRSGPGCPEEELLEQIGREGRIGPFEGEDVHAGTGSAGHVELGDHRGE